MLISRFPGSLGFVKRALGDAGHTLISAGAFVFDDDDDYLSGEQVDVHRMKLQVRNFIQRSVRIERRPEF